MTIGTGLPSLLTAPSILEMATTDVLPIGFDTSALLQEGQSPSNSVVTITDIQTSQIAEQQSGPTIDGDIIIQVIVGSTLLAGHDYRIAWIFTAATDTTWTEFTILRVRF